MEHTGFDTFYPVNSECSAPPNDLYLIPEYGVVGDERCKLEFSELPGYHNPNKNPAAIATVRIKENSIPEIVRAICALLFMWSL